MASKVNVKFVAILAGVLVALTLGVAFAAYSVMVKTPEQYEALGDRAMQAGRHDEARLFYSKGVRKDQTNVELMEKWLSAMEHWQPATETVYRANYQGTFLLAHRGLAEAQRENPEAQARLLGMFQRQNEIGTPTRASVDFVVTSVERALEPFEMMSDPPEGWQRLRRFRGIALESLQAAGLVVSPEELTLAKEDLRAAIEADPSDGRSLASLAQILSREADALYAADRRAEGDQRYAEAQEVVDAFIRRTPNEPWSQLFSAFLAFDRERAKATAGKLPDEARAINLALLPRFEARFEPIVEAVRAHPSNASSQLLQMVARFEASVRPGAGQAATRRLVDDLLEARPDDTLLMLTAARQLEADGVQDRAAELYTKVAALPDLPMSLDGFLRFEVRRQAIISHADLLIRKVLESQGMNAEEKRSLLAEAKALRDRYAAQTSTGDLRLLFIDGVYALAQEDMPTAIRLFQQYNQQTSNSDPRGLGGLAQAALRLGQEGVGETALEQLVALQPANLSALVELAAVKARLQKNAAAEVMLRRAQSLDPDNEVIAERLRLIRALQNPASAEDPVVGAILAARNVKVGSEKEPPDPSRAESMLVEALARHDDSPMIARELIVMQLDAGRLDDARAVVARAAQRHPGDEGLARVARALESGTLVEAMIALIDDSDLPTLDALLAKRSLLANSGMPEEAARLLSEAESIAPEDPRVFEARFLDAVGRDDTAEVDRLARRAVELDIDRLGGLTYRSRALALQSRYEEAITVMQQAISQGAAPSAAYRLLAAQQRSAGRLNDAAATLSRALEIKPDSVPTILDYVATLNAAGRQTDALAAARRMETYGRSDPSFVDAWLNLEASAGGRPGRTLAIERRQRMTETDPSNQVNKARLAALLTEDRRWDEADELISDLAEQGESLLTVQLRARWLADQGQVLIDGQARSGMELARATFTDYIVSLPEEEVTAEPWMVMAAFMADRGDLETAAAALEQARPLQDPEEMNADKLLGDLMLTRGRFALARTAYQRVVEGNADDARQTYLQRLIEATLRLNEHAEAVTLLDRLTGPASASLTAKLQRAEALTGLGRTAQARDLLNQAVAEHPSDPLPFTLRARATLTAGGFPEDALADLDNALRIDPSNSRARRMRAMIYFDQGRKEDALRDLREVVRQNPSLDEVGFALVQEYLTMGRSRDAAGVVDEVVEKRPQDAQMMVGYGVIYAQNDDWIRATQLFAMAWERTKSPPIGARLLDGYLRQRPPQVPKAREVLSQIKAVVPNHEEVSAIVSLDATIAWAAGQKDEARRLMTRAFELGAAYPRQVFAWNTNLNEVFTGEPPHAIIAFMRTIRPRLDAEAARWLDMLIAQRLASQEGTLDEGLSALRELLAAKSDDAVALIAHRGLGAALYGADRNDEARRAWEQGLAAFPEDWELSNNLAFLLVDRFGQAREALPHAQRAAQAAPQLASVLDTLATVQIALGQFNEADSTIDAAQGVAMAPTERADVLLTRANLEIKRGNTEQARALLADASELVSSFGDARERYQTKIQDRLDQIGSADD